jgi:hypothetical protein
LARRGQLVGLREFPGYHISSDGRLWSSWVRVGWMIDPETIKPVKVPRDRGGYLGICLKRSGRRVKRLIHRLVLEAFQEPCPDGMEACHNNGVRDDNRLENLRWDTRSENQLDRSRHGTDLNGTKHPSAKLQESDIREIFRARANGLTQNQIARIYGITDQTVCLILQRKMWKNVEI